MFMLRLRVERLNGERTFSQKPKSRCHHVIQRPFIDEFDAGAGRFVTNTNMHYVETRLDEQFLLALTATHELRLVDGALRIANKKVELLNSDAAFGNIQLLP
jgi:3-phenylpropionate/cinnamic acid dioxygenase small subunit